MLINKSIKKFILLLLLLTLPAQTMSMPSWVSFSSMKESVTQIFSTMRKTFGWHKEVAAETQIEEARKANASKAANAIAEFFANKKAEAEKEAAREEALRKKINSTTERRCFICLAEKHEITEEKLLPKVKCLSDSIHTGKIHKKCLREALSIDGKCPLCRFSPSLQILHERERRRREEEQRDFGELKRAQEERQKLVERGRLRREEEDEDDQKFIVDMLSKLLYDKERKRKEEEDDDQKCMRKVRRKVEEGTKRVFVGRKRRKEERDDDQSAFEGVNRRAEEAQRQAEEAQSQREEEARMLDVIERVQEVGPIMLNLALLDQE